MDPVIIVVIVVVVVLIVVALVVLVPRARRQANERRQVQATAHRREAERLAAQAASAQAAAEEREAAARRERAEAELRAGEAQRDAEASLTEAERQRAEAQRLEAKAAKLDPDYADRGNGTGLRGDDTAGSTHGVRSDDRPVDRQDGPYVDRGNDKPDSRQWFGCARRSPIGGPSRRARAHPLNPLWRMREPDPRWGEPEPISSPRSVWAVETSRPEGRAFVL